MPPRELAEMETLESCPAKSVIQCWDRKLVFNKNLDDSDAGAHEPFLKNSLEILRTRWFQSYCVGALLSKLFTLINFTVPVPANIPLKLCKRFPLNQLLNWIP